MVNPQKPLPRHHSDATREVRGTSGSHYSLNLSRTSVRYPYLPPGPLSDAAPASMRPPYLLRQATFNIREPLLTILLLEQTSLASIGPNSLGLAPKAPLPGPALRFPSRAPVPTLPRGQCPPMTVQSPSPTCRSLPRRHPLSSLPSSLNVQSPMLSRRESSRATSIWTKHANRCMLMCLYHGYVMTAKVLATAKDRPSEGTICLSAYLPCSVLYFAEFSLLAISL